MPVVAVSVKRLNELLNKQYKMNVLVDALEQLGCDVEDTAELGLFQCPACQTPNDRLEHEEPPKRCDFCGHESEEPFVKYATDKVIRIDLLADRPDLFDTGGLSRALKGYLELEKGLSEFTVKEGKIEVNVDPVLSQKETFRPYIACAVITMPHLDQTSLREIMRLQENLHWGIGRDRKLSSIGVYDMGTLTPPIKYTTVDPIKFKFCPLGMPGVQMTPQRILEEHPKGVAYAYLMDNYKRYPILMDANDLVLAMPPIINSDETKCKINSSRLFVDVTGITQDAVINSLNTLVSALIELGGEVETVKMNYPEGPKVTPDLSPKKINIKLDAAQNWLGLDFSREEFMGYLHKMRLNVEPKKDVYEVSYPAFRSDIRHEVDLFEDLAIGYGFKNIQTKLVPSLTIGEARKEEELSQIVRKAMTGLGFTEIMSLHLQSVERHFTKYQMEPGKEHVIIKNPKTIEQYRHLAFAIIGPETGYAEGRMVLDSIMRELNYKGDYKPVSHPAFCQGRCAEVTGDAGLWARAGEIHPQVLNNFGLTYPVSYCELRLVKVI
jgi:phenylalanyl-tRNA synthetase beta chain